MSHVFPFSLLVVSAVLPAVFLPELHITKFIAAYYKNNPLIAYEMCLFRPRIL